MKLEIEVGRIISRNRMRHRGGTSEAVVADTIEDLRIEVVREFCRMYPTAQKFVMQQFPDIFENAR